MSRTPFDCDHSLSTKLFEIEERLMAADFKASKAKQYITELEEDNQHWKQLHMKDMECNMRLAQALDKAGYPIVLSCLIHEPWPKSQR